jgi:hypothetical protein
MIKPTASRSDDNADAEKKCRGQEGMGSTAHLLGKLTGVFTLQARYVHLNRVSDKNVVSKRGKTAN